MITTNLNTKLPEVPIPAYFFHGIYDYTCSYPEAKAYFQNLKAPIKGFYTFDQSAHSPIFEEPEKVIKSCKPTCWQKRIVLPTANALPHNRASEFAGPTRSDRCGYCGE